MNIPELCRITIWMTILLLIGCPCMFLIGYLSELSKCKKEEAKWDYLIAQMDVFEKWYDEHYSKNKTTEQMAAEYQKYLIEKNRHDPE